MVMLKFLNILLLLLTIGYYSQSIIQPLYHSVCPQGRALSAKCHLVSVKRKTCSCSLSFSLSLSRCSNSANPLYFLLKSWDRQINTVMHRLVHHWSLLQLCVLLQHEINMNIKLRDSQTCFSFRSAREGENTFLILCWSNKSDIILL